MLLAKALGRQEARWAGEPHSGPLHWRREGVAALAHVSMMKFNKQYREWFVASPRSEGLS